MFTNHWIVADMDGTLTPTPSRAHGNYLSLSHCMSTGLGYGARYRSCLPWLRFFLAKGGSLCVVSTAGKRMWMQLYEDLAPVVLGLSTINGMTTNSNGDSGSVSETSSVPSSEGAQILSAGSTAPGTLYMCGFTGAAMFRTRPYRAVWADMDELHPGWRASSSVRSAESRTGFTIPPPAVGMEEWAAYRQQAAACDSTNNTAANTAAGVSFSLLSTTTLDADTCAVAAEEGRNALIRFFEHVSYVCCHDTTAARSFFGECLSTKYHTVFTAILQQLLDEVGHPLRSAKNNGGAVPHLCFAKAQVLSPQALTAHGFFLKATKDALLDVQRVPQADGTATESAPVAQVVVMGLPMRYFDGVFPFSSSSSSSSSTSLSLRLECCKKCAAVGAGAKARLEAAGLELKSQPNSVCLHRRGVDKGTCVRWLRAAGKNSRMAESGGGPLMSFELTKAIALGDAPESVDRPLTEYPPMQFISLSPKDGAAERLAEMQAAAATSSSSFHNSLTYMFHVGGEEEGTALFLEELFTSCAKEAGEGRHDVVCERTWFTPERVSACAARAHASVNALLGERRSNNTAGGPSRSTL